MKVEHIGIIVEDIEKAVDNFSRYFNIPRPEIRDRKEEKTKIAYLEAENIAIELLEDYSGSGMLADFLKEKGGGLHHFSLASKNLEKDMEEMEERGLSFESCYPKVGLRGKKIAFTTKEAFQNFCLELSEQRSQD